MWGGSCVGRGCPGPFWVGTRRGGWSGRRQRVGLEGRDGGVGQELAAWGAAGWLAPTPRLPRPCSVPRRCAVGTGSPCSSVRVVALVSPHGVGKGSPVLPQGPSWPGFGILRPLLLVGLGMAWGHPWDLGLRAARGSGVLLWWGAGVPAPRYPKNISGFCWLAGLRHLLRSPPPAAPPAPQAPFRGLARRRGAGGGCLRLFIFGRPPRNLLLFSLP